MQRLLVIRGGAVGDLILTLPALGALRALFPQATLELLGHPSRAILAHHPAYAHRIVDLEQGDVYRLFSPQARLSEALASYLRSFNLIVSYLPTPEEPLAINLQRYCAGRILTWVPHPPGHMHITDHLLQPLTPWMHEPYPAAVPQVYVTPEAQATAERFWRMAGLPESGVIAWHPGSGGHYKLWPLEGWQQVMTWAAQQGYPGLIISGPAEQDRHGFASVAASFPAWPHVRHLSLPEVAAILARCHLLIGHDSGISHLGAAVGTTTLTFFGPTMPYIWGPRSRRACVLQPHPAGPLTLRNLPPAVVINLLASLMHDTFQFVPSRVDCTILVVTNTAELLPLP